MKRLYALVLNPSSPYRPHKEVQSPGSSGIYARRKTTDFYIYSPERRLYKEQAETIFNATRFFDVIISLVCLILLLPFLVLIAVLIKVTSKGPVVFAQQRVGKNNEDFRFYKFRTMYVNNAEKNFLTIGERDKRITPVGVFLRRFKLDELPQLYNVLNNEMSIVGPRPEVRKYVSLYSEAQKEMLNLKPGITDYASIAFVNESALLAKHQDAEAFYIKEIMPLKIELNRKYAEDKSLRNYFTIILKTFFSIAS